MLFCFSYSSSLNKMLCKLCTSFSNSSMGIFKASANVLLFLAVQRSGLIGLHEKCCSFM